MQPRATTPERPFVSRSVQLRFLLSASAWMLLLYGAYYYPYDPEGAVGRAIDAYLVALAWGSRGLIGLLEQGVSVQGTVIEGRFALHIVKSCSSLDAQALYVASVLAFPSSLRAKLLGVIVGVFALTCLNLIRIAVLYFVGADASQSFDTVHEELLPLVLVAAALACFMAWARRASDARA